MKRLYALAFALMLVWPTVGAQSSVDQLFPDDILGRTLDTRIAETNFEDTNAVHTDNATWLQFHSYELSFPQSVLLVEISYTGTIVQASDGTLNYTFETNTGDWPECFFHITTVAPGGFLEGDLVTYPNVQLNCAQLAELELDEEFTFWINRTVLSGTPPTPDDEHFGITIDKRDIIIESMPTDFETLTGLTGIEFALFPAMALVGIILWSRSQDTVVRAWGGVLSMVSGILLLGVGTSAGLGEVWSGTVAFASSLVLVGGYLLVRLFLDQREGLAA